MPPRSPRQLGRYHFLRVGKMVQMLPLPQQQCEAHQKAARGLLTGGFLEYSLDDCRENVVSVRGLGAGSGSGRTEVVVFVSLEDAVHNAPVHRF